MTSLVENLPHVASRLVMPIGIALDSTSVYVIAAETRIRSISRQLSLEDGFSIATIPINGGRPKILAWEVREYAREHTQGGLTLEATSVYYTDVGAGTVLKMTPK